MDGRRKQPRDQEPLPMSAHTPRPTGAPQPGPPTPRIRVAVVEDDARLRRAFLEALDTSPDCLPIGAFATATEAVREIPALRPDVVIVDVNLPDSTGVEHIAALSTRIPTAQILIVTVYQDPETTFQALAAGAHGYLVKPVMPDRLLEAIREVREGGVPMTRTIARKVIQAFRDHETGIAAPPADVQATDASAAARTAVEAALAPREQQVLELLCEGCYYKEIAKRLGISISTVGTYVNRIYEKLHCTNRWEVVEKSRGGHVR
jgi:RNA polymerase sigma factor (sigma-70 family)